MGSLIFSAPHRRCFSTAAIAILLALAQSSRAQLPRGRPTAGADTNGASPSDGGPGTPELVPLQALLNISGPAAGTQGVNSGRPDVGGVLQGTLAALTMFVNSTANTVRVTASGIRVPGAPVPAAATAAAALGPNATALSVNFTILRVRIPNALTASVPSPGSAAMATSPAGAPVVVPVARLQGSVFPSGHGFGVARVSSPTLTRILADPSQHRVALSYPGAPNAAMSSPFTTLARADNSAPDFGMSSQRRGFPPTDVGSGAGTTPSRMSPGLPSAAASAGSSAAGVAASVNVVNLVNVDVNIDPGTVPSLLSSLQLLASPSGIPEGGATQSAGLGSSAVSLRNLAMVLRQLRSAGMLRYALTALGNGPDVRVGSTGG